MPESEDELELLRAADPLDRASVPSPDNPKAQALFERITMSNAESTDLSPILRPNRPTWVWAAAAAAAVAVLVGGAWTVAASRDTPKADPPIAQEPTGPISPGGTMASCIEVYDLQTLARRELAFDGTVQSVEGDNVTFSVNEWYRGGSAPQISLGGAGGLSGFSSAGESTSLESGTRLLVAGDGGFAWSCGFTQPFDPAVAGEWKRALAS